MRKLVVVAVLALVLAGGVLVAESPTAAACTGDPSVCGIVKDVRCTMEHGEAALDRCWRWV